MSATSIKDPRHVRLGVQYAWLYNAQTDALDSGSRLRKCRNEVAAAWLWDLGLR